MVNRRLVKLLLAGHTETKDPTTSGQVVSHKQHYKGFALTGGSLQDFEGVVSLYHLCRHVALEGVVLILALAPSSEF